MKYRVRVKRRLVGKRELQSLLIGVTVPCPTLGAGHNSRWVGVRLVHRCFLPCLPFPSTVVVGGGGGGGKELHT